MLFFALFGMGALVVDMGLVSATRVRMQAAVDAGAMAGLALEASPAADAGERIARRSRVQQAMGRVLADDLLPAANLDNDPDGDLRHFVQDGAQAYRASLRRVSTEWDPDAARPGVRNAGAPLPLLFGMGSTIRADAPGSPRVHGLAVGAQAVAAARPARVVGRRVTAAGATLVGVTDFAVDTELWSRLPVGVAGEVREQAGLLVGVGSLAGGRGLRFGALDGAAHVGDLLPPAAAGGLATVSDGFVPVYDGATRRIVGFGRTSVAFDATTGRYRITKAARSVAPRNASAASTVPLAVATPDLATRIEAFGRNEPVGSGIEPSEPLLAVALSR